MGLAGPVLVDQGDPGCRTELPYLGVDDEALARDRDLPQVGHRVRFEHGGRGQRVQPHHRQEQPGDALFADQVHQGEGVLAFLVGDDDERGPGQPGGDDLLVAHVEADRGGLEGVRRAVVGPVPHVPVAERGQHRRGNGNRLGLTGRSGRGDDVPDGPLAQLLQRGAAQLAEGDLGGAEPGRRGVVGTDQQGAEPGDPRGPRRGHARVDADHAQAGPPGAEHRGAALPGPFAVDGDHVVRSQATGGEPARDLGGQPVEFAVRAGDAAVDDGHRRGGAPEGTDHVYKRQDQGPDERMPWSARVVGVHGRPFWGWCGESGEGCGRGDGLRHAVPRPARRSAPPAGRARPRSGRGPTSCTRAAVGARPAPGR